MAAVLASASIPAPVRVAVIGCGLIGSRWDEQRPDDGPSLTHGRAFSRHPGSQVVAFCDPDIERAQQAARRWGGVAYADAQRLFAEQAVDLAVIASSSAARSAVIEPALAAGVHTLVIEKPLATTLAESRSLAAQIDAAGARTVVNYLRHWDPTMRSLGQRLRAGEFGPVQRLVGSYGKGLVNNGSHLIDLAGALCDAQPLRVRALGSPLSPAEASWSAGADRALDAQIEWCDADGRSVQLDMIGTDQCAFTCFELRVICRDAVIEIAQGGRRIELAAVEADPDYPGYRIPGRRQTLPAQSLQAMDQMADDAIALASGRLSRSRCDVALALRTAHLVEAIRQSAADGGNWVDVSAPD